MGKYTHKTSNGIRCFILNDRFCRTTDRGYVRAFIEDSSAKIGGRLEVVNEKFIRRLDS